MGRALRLIDPELPYHVGTRGNDRRAIVLDDWDRCALVGMLGDVVERYCLVVFAWCLMNNHFHAILRAPEGGLSEAMQELLGGYARRWNIRYGRTGHLFHNRFYGGAIESDKHLLETSRYVVLNPVRAGICGHPGRWTWSSYRASAGLEPAPAWLALGEFLPFFDPAPADAFRRYRQFVSQGQVPVSDTETGPVRPR